MERAVAELLRLQGVSKTFGGLRAVQEVSLALPAGRLSALIGPNGAGKTTLFALMSGFLRPDTGTVWLDGEDITGQSPQANARRGMTRTFQIVQPFAAQTVRENIAVGAHLHTARRAEALAQAEAVAAPGRLGAIARPARRRPHRGRPQAPRTGASARHPAPAPAARRGAGRPEPAGSRRDAAGGARHRRRRRDGADDRARDAGRDEPGRARLGAGAGAVDRRGLAGAGDARSRRHRGLPRPRHGAAPGAAEAAR
jgi:hypothetical protein